VALSSVQILDAPGMLIEFGEQTVNEQALEKFMKFTAEKLL
jgi:hypothetical protein